MNVIVTLDINNRILHLCILHYDFSNQIEPDFLTNYVISYLTVNI